MGKLLTAMAIGFFLYKKGVLKQETNSSLSWMVVNITLPCLVLSSLSSVPGGNIRSVLMLLAAGFITYGAYIAIGFIFVKIFRIPDFVAGVYVCMIIFSNNAFMGYPVAQSLFGDSAIFYLTIFNQPMNLLFFTLGMILIRRCADKMGDQGEKKPLKVRDLLNNAVIACLVSLVLYLCNLHLPEGLSSVLSFIGSITTPLSMIIIGSSLATASIRDIRTEKALVPMMVFRLALIPLFVWFFVQLFIHDKTMAAVCVVGAGMPVASIIGMSSVDYPRQNRAAAVGIAISTIMSLISIPVMSSLLLKAAG